MKPPRSPTPGGPPYPDEPISLDLHANIEILRQSLGRKTPDIIIRHLRLGHTGQAAALVFINGMANAEQVSETILRPLLEPSEAHHVNQSQAGSGQSDPITEVAARLTTPEAQIMEGFRPALRHLLDGKVLLFQQGSARALSLGLQAIPSRSVGEPDTEQVIRGPREGFTEKLSTSGAQLRRRIKTPAFRMEQLQVGKQTETDMLICYIDGVADPAVVAEARHRLHGINVAGILAAGQIEELITDHPLSPFPMMLMTERPDKVAGMLLEGRFAILIDGTPIAIVAPIQFISFLQAPDDYYGNWIAASFIRLVRTWALLTTLLLPATYVALSTFHQEIIPTPLALSIAAGREGVPLPAFAEALGMEMAFEVIREAGLRIPRPIGSAVTIVGTLVVGQAAVEAGVVSPIMIIVVGLTSIAGFALPSPTATDTFRLMRFPFILLAAGLGLLGIFWALLGLLLHLVSLRSFGVPYLAPFGPMVLTGWRDALMRLPIWMLNRRPPMFGQQNPVQQGPDQMPVPPTRPGTRRRRQEE